MTTVVSSDGGQYFMVVASEGGTTSPSNLLLDFVLRDMGVSEPPSVHGKAILVAQWPGHQRRHQPDP